MGGYYDEPFVDKLVSQLKVKGGEPYIHRTVLQIGPMLEDNPAMYKTFGVYWWAIKSALHKYYGNRSAWFMGPATDDLMMRRAWHGDLFRTVVAGAYFHSTQLSEVSDHEYTDDKGVDHPYTLFDADAGQ